MPSAFVCGEEPMSVARKYRGFTRVGFATRLWERWLPRGLRRFGIVLAALVCPSLLPAQSGDTSASYTQELKERHLKMLEQQQSLESWDQNRMANFGRLPPAVEAQHGLRSQEAFAEFQTAVIGLQRVFLEHQVAFEATHDRERLEAYGLQLNTCQAKLEAWQATLAEAYRQAPDQSHALEETIREMIVRDAGKDIYEGIYPLAAAWLEHAEEIEPSLLESIGFTGYANNDYDLADRAWRKLSQVQPLPSLVDFLWRSIPTQRERWEQEQRIREREQVEDRNPRVALLTNKGRIEVELFEDQAPQAVANFIYLVEGKYYHNKSFFRVLPRSGAQTGCDRGDGTGNAGYTIRGEMGSPEHRSVFRGALVLLSGTEAQTNRPDPDSGSSQFVITLLPQPALDGEQTVFGRVTRGMAVVGALTRLDHGKEEERKDRSKRPDRIVEARVLRKRDHPYLPEPVRGRLP
jgi:cyclophilin family peptidyl-prolyl cis-trans isomerase